MNTPPPTTTPTLRLAAWVLLILILLPGQVGWLYALRGHHLLTGESTLIWGQLVLGLSSVGMLLLLKTTPPDAIRIPPRAGAALVIGGTLLLQLAAIALLAPALSDDMLRYRSDGRMWLGRTSPYATPPSEFFAKVPPDVLDAMVPYADWRTVYPPVSQAVFAAARAVDDALHVEQTGGDSGFWRERIVRTAAVRRTVVFRTVFALFAVAGVVILVVMLRRNGESAWWAAVVGWSPLLTLEIGGMGHQDAIGMFLVLLTVWGAATGRFRIAAGALAMACGVKPVAILLLPFLWRQTHEEQSFRAGRRMLLVFVVTLGVVFIPAMSFQNGFAGWRESLSHFGRAWEANGFLYESFKGLFGNGDEGRQMERAKDAARLVSFLAVLLTGLFLWQSRARVAEGGYWLWMVLLLCSPVAYPWYLVWPLCFVPLLRGSQGVAAVVWSATAAMSYTIWRAAPAVWAVPPGWLAAQYVPVLVVLLVEVVRLARVAPLCRVAGGVASEGRGAASAGQAQRLKV